ncbi:type II secretion system protein N [Dyella sp.]|uniref:type II secretion system protein N n=1 Tax=Dyella sp. TaxID=1869338 RepID=UPI002D7728A2|nr:type II secretion system protein N [Dyella sp.]HET6433253.1 type II secretion system protein N [Dyella sp.]
MKWWKKLLLGLAAVLAALVLVLWFAPARWFVPLVEARLGGAQLRAVSGSMWDGRVGEVVLADGTALGRLDWQLSRRALLGQVRLHAAVAGPVVRGHADLAQDGNHARWRDVQLAVTLDALPQPPATPWGVPRGEVILQLEQMQVINGWPDSVTGRVRWPEAVMQTPQATVALGELLAELSGSHGVLRADLHDAGAGPLALAGVIQLSPIGWRLDARLSARHADPALQRWLTRLGPPDAQGVVHLQRGAGVGALSAGASR